MFFTQEDYRKIEKWLLSNSIKDTDFVGAATPLQGNETLAFVQKGKNVKVSLKDLIDQIFLLGVSDFLNISDKYKENYISLNQAMALVPNKSRKIGQVITFLNQEGVWKIYQFQGTKVNQWNNTTLWIDLIQQIQGLDIIDSEDIIPKISATNQTSLLLADKSYNPDDFSGLGKVYLRKNMQKVINPNTGIYYTTNLLTQAMVSKENTIYIIQYDYSLNYQTITIPDNCILQFKGGSMNDGTLEGTSSINILNEMNFKIFKDIKFITLLEYSYPEWFGAKGDGYVDDTLPVQSAITNSNMVKLKNKVYCVKNIDIHSDFILKGDSITSTLKCLDYTGTRKLLHYINIGFRSSNYDYNNLSSMYNENGTFENIEIYNLTIDGGRKNSIDHFFLYNSIGCWLKGGTLRNINIHHCNFYNNINNSIMFQSWDNSTIIDNINISNCNFICTTDLQEIFTDGTNTYKNIGDGIYFRRENETSKSFTTTNIKVDNCYGENIRTLVDYKEGCNHGIISNCKTKNIQDCDYSIDGSINIDILDCECFADENLSPIMGPAPGIYSTNALELAGSNIKVSNLNIYANDKMSDGIFVTNYDDYDTNNIIIQDCTIVGVLHQGIRCLSVDNLQIQNNNIKNYSYHGISIGDGSTNVFINNNILYSDDYITHIYIDNKMDITRIPYIYINNNTFNNYPALISCNTGIGNQYAYINKIYSNPVKILNQNVGLKLYRKKYKSKEQSYTLNFGNTYPNVSNYSLQVGNTDSSAYQLDNFKYFNVEGNGLYISFFAKGVGGARVMIQCWSDNGFVKNILKDVVITDSWEQYIIVLDFKKEFTPDIIKYNINIRSTSNNFIDFSYPQVSMDYISRINEVGISNFSLDYTTYPELGTTEETPNYNTAVFNLGKSFFNTDTQTLFTYGINGWINPDGTLSSKVVII